MDQREFERTIVLVSKGYPVDRARAFLELVAPGNKTFRKRVMPRTAIRRRKRGGDGPQILGKAAAERIVRLERLWETVVEIYQQDLPSARHFLFTPHMLLDDVAPIDFALAGETHAVFLDGVMASIRHGFAV